MLCESFDPPNPRRTITWSVGSSLRAMTTLIQAVFAINFLGLSTAVLANAWESRDETRMFPCPTPPSDVTVHESGPPTHAHTAHRHGRVGQHTGAQKVSQKTVEAVHARPSCPTLMGPVLARAPRAHPPPEHVRRGPAGGRGGDGRLPASAAARAAALRGRGLRMSTTKPAAPVASAPGSVRRSFIG